MHLTKRRNTSTLCSFFQGSEKGRKAHFAILVRKNWRNSSKTSLGSAEASREFGFLCDDECQVPRIDPPLRDKSCGVVFSLSQGEERRSHCFRASTLTKKLIRSSRFAWLNCRNVICDRRDWRLLVYRLTSRLKGTWLTNSIIAWRRTLRRSLFNSTPRHSQPPTLLLLVVICWDEAYFRFDPFTQLHFEKERSRAATVDWR